MTKNKKIFLWIVGGAGALLVVLLAFLLILPKIINIAPVKEKILANVSRTVGGDVACQQLNLSFLPRPHVEIYQGTLTIPEKITGHVGSLKVYLKIWPLFKGQFQFTSIRVEAPDFKIGLPEKPEIGKDPQEQIPFEVMIQEKVTPLLAQLLSQAPDLVVAIEEGRLSLTENQQSEFSFDQLQARITLSPSSIGIDLSCRSNLFDTLTVKASLVPEDYRGKGQVHLARFRPHLVMNNLFPQAGRRVGDSPVDLDLNFETSGLTRFQAEVTGSIPHLALHQADQKLVIKGINLKGDFLRDGDKTSATLTQLNLEYPRLQVTGKFRMAEASPRFSLELEGREVDVHSTREAALALVGHDRVVQMIFDILRGGETPWVYFKTQGDSVEDLGKLDNLFIQGRLTKGKIGTALFLPGIDTDLEDAVGDITISKGMLEGENLKARLGNEHGYNGTMRLGLEGKDAPFHMEADVEVDLSKVPSVLKMIIKDDKFMEQISRVSGLKGRAHGRLILGESLGAIKPRVNVSQINFAASYRGIPYPLEITTGELSYAEDTLKVNELSGNLGKSSFSSLAARLSRVKGVRIEVLSGTSNVSLDEVYAWLSSIKAMKAKLKTLESVGGQVALSQVRLKGPILEPGKWHYDVKGKIETLAVTSTLLPAKLAVSGGRFEVNPQKLTLKDAQTDILDASLRVSGIVTDYLKGIKKVSFSCNGKMGAKALKRISDLAHVPPKLKIRPPLSISQLSGEWHRNGKMSFSGDLAVGDVPKVSLDIHLNQGELVIKQLLIEDQDSRATFGLHFKEKEFHLNFKGKLHKSTLDRLLVKNEILSGWVKGDIETHIFPDRPKRSTARGNLEGKGLGHPLQLGIPASLDSISLVALKDKIDVKSASIALGENHLNLEGHMGFSEEAFSFDMDLSADGLEWAEVEQIFQKKEEKSGLSEPEKPWKLPFRGSLRLKTTHFDYKGFIWRPLHVNISFEPENIVAEFIEAELCGVSTPGVVKVTPQDISVNIEPAAENQDFKTAVKCLSYSDTSMTGTFDFKGNVTGQGKADQLVKALKGKLEYVAKDGRIYRHVPLKKVLAYLNVTEVFKGKIPDMKEEGFPYKSITVETDLKNGTLSLKEGILDSVSMKIIARGDWDLTNDKIDFVVLVAPLKTVDSIVGKIPLVRRIFKDSLVSIPVKVKGDLRNPQVTPLSPSAVGSEILGIMARTLTLPFTLIEPIIHKRKENQDASQKTNNKDLQ